MTAVDTVRDQARTVARGWSGPGTPESWQLTAALFNGLADDGDLLAMASAIPADRLPALLFVAGVQLLATTGPDVAEPFTQYFPVTGTTTHRPVDDALPDHYRAFCIEHHLALASVWASHVYQMNEVARCSQVALALAAMEAAHPGRRVGLIDVGTGAGFGLYPDTYHYRIGDAISFGHATSPVQIDCELMGHAAPTTTTLPTIVERIWIDRDPIDVHDADAAAWLMACLPPEAGAIARIGGAIETVRHQRPTIIRGMATAAVADALDRMQASDVDLLCLVDTFTAVFFDESERRSVADLVAAHSASRPTAWISLDPLVPLGEDARHTVHGQEAPPELVEQNRRDGVFGALSLLTHIDGQQRVQLLATSHSSGTRMRWLGAS